MCDKEKANARINAAENVVGHHSPSPRQFFELMNAERF